MLLSQFFRCISCQGRLEPEAFPYCDECIARLVPSPPLCRQCFSPACPPESCRRPWLERNATDSALATISARYLLVGPGYKTLRLWKWRGGSAPDRRLLNADAGAIPNWRALGIQAVVPMPQRFARAWSLGGSPAERVARWLARETDTPVIRALAPAHSARRARQATLTLSERIRNPLNVSFTPLTPRLAGKTILLVDDFLTTGRTLRAAARALRHADVREIHAFCLGARPPKMVLPAPCA